MKIISLDELKNRIKWWERIFNLKDDIDLRIESLKYNLEKIRENLHSEIDDKFDELKWVKDIY